jgi:hypothetical protein
MLAIGVALVWTRCSGPRRRKKTPSGPGPGRGDRRAGICDSSPAMRRLVVVAVLTLAVGVPAARRRSGRRRLAASGCPLFPANVWHADVSRLPVHPRSGAYLAAMGPRGRDPRRLRLRHLGRAGRSASPTRSSRPSQPKVLVRFGYAGESDPGPLPDPAGAPVEGGPDAGRDRHVLVVQAGTCRLYELFDAHPEVRRLAGRVGGGVRPARQPAAARPAGPRPTPPGCRSWPGWSATRRWPGAGRPRHPGHRRPQPGRLPVAGPPPRPARAGRRCRRWGCGCGLRAGVSHRRVPRPGPGDPAGDADLRAGGGRQRHLGVHRRGSRRALGQRRPPPARAGHPGRLRGRRHRPAARLAPGSPADRRRPGPGARPGGTAGPARPRKAAAPALLAGAGRRSLTAEPGSRPTCGASATSPPPPPRPPAQAAADGRATGGGLVPSSWPASSAWSRPPWPCGWWSPIASGRRPAATPGRGRPHPAATPRRLPPR